MSLLYIIIPARFPSSRLPGKVLLKIDHKTMLEHVVLKAQALAKSVMKTISEIKGCHVIVATDHDMIFKKAEALGALGVMTDPDLISGSQRSFAGIELLKKNKKIKIKNNDLVLNIQGDQPFLSIPDTKKLIKDFLKRKQSPLGTTVYPSSDPEKYLAASYVKVLFDQNHRAIYFSRAPIPFFIDVFGHGGSEWKERLNIESFQSKPISFFIHQGVYLFRYKSLKEYSLDLKKTTLDRTESLEQLKALEAGWDIFISVSKEESMGIDTPADLLKAQQYLMLSQS